MQLLETRCNCHKLLVICIRGFWRENGPSVEKNFIINWGFFFPGCLSLSILLRLVLFVFVVAQTFEKKFMVNSSNQKYRVTWELSPSFYLRLDWKHFISSVSRNTSQSWNWRNGKKSSNTSHRRIFLQLLRVLPNSYEYFHSLKTEKMSYTSLRKHCYRENETRDVAVFLGPSYMVSGTRDSLPPKASLSSVYIWKHGSCRPSHVNAAWLFITLIE